MKQNEQIYCVFMVLAWIGGVLAFWNIMNIQEGATGTLAVFTAAFGIYALHANAKWQ